MSTTIQMIQPKLKALAIYQIIGGVAGLLSIIQLFNSPFSFSTPLLLLMLLAVALYGYSIYCGIILLKNSEQGLMLSKINQLLQAVYFAVSGYAFQYVSGVYFFVGLNLTEGFVFKFELGLSTWKINLGSLDPEFIIMVNIVALFLIAFIDKAVKQLRAAAAEEQLSHLVQNEEMEPLSTP